MNAWVFAWLQQEAIRGGFFGRQMYRLSPVGAAKPTPAVFVGLRHLPQSSNCSALYLSAYAASCSLSEANPPNRNTTHFSAGTNSSSISKHPSTHGLKWRTVLSLCWPGPSLKDFDRRITPSEFLPSKLSRMLQQNYSFASPIFDTRAPETSNVQSCPSIDVEWCSFQVIICRAYYLSLGLGHVSASAHSEGKPKPKV